MKKTLRNLFLLAGLFLALSGGATAQTAPPAPETALIVTLPTNADVQAQREALMQTPDVWLAGYHAESGAHILMTRLQGRDLRRTERALARRFPNGQVRIASAAEAERIYNVNTSPDGAR